MRLSPWRWSQFYRSAPASGYPPVEGIDYEAIGYGHPGDWQPVVEYLADWIAGREVWREPAARQLLAAWRERNLYRYQDNRELPEALHQDCTRCEKEAKPWSRPGARQPRVSCEGCPLSYLHKLEFLTEPRAFVTNLLTPTSRVRGRRRRGKANS